MATTPAEERLRALFDATIALTSELSLDSLLQKLVETAAALTGARYAALGVIDEAGLALERFITTGVDRETHAAIGDLPRGRGILGVHEAPRADATTASPTRTGARSRWQPPPKVAVGDATEQDRHTEEGSHLRMVRRKADRAWIFVQVV